VKKYLWLLLVFVTSYAITAQLNSNAKLENLIDFSGGLNTSDSPNKLEKNESPNILNVLIDEKSGSLYGRNGFELFGSSNTLTKINLLAILDKETGTDEFIVSDSSIVLATSDFNTWTKLAGPLNTGVVPRAKQVRNKIWITNGFDSVFTYDGSTVVVLNGTTYGGVLFPSVPKFKYIEYMNERVFGFNDPVNGGSALSFSALVSTNGTEIAPDSSLAWPSANTLYVGQGDGSVGTGLKVFKGQLRIFKENSIYTLFGIGASDYEVRKTISDSGFISNESVVEREGLLIGQTKNGIEAFNGTDMQFISDKIGDEISESLTDTSKVITDYWDSFSDFTQTVSSYSISGGTVTSNGFISIYPRREYVRTVDSVVEPTTGYLTFTSNDIGGGTDWFTLLSTNTFPTSFSGYLGQDQSLTTSWDTFMSFWNANVATWTTPSGPGNGLEVLNANAHFRNTRTGAVWHSKNS